MRREINRDWVITPIAGLTATLAVAGSPNQPARPADGVTSLARDAVKTSHRVPASIRKGRPAQYVGQTSPRKRMSIVLPEEPKPRLDPGTIAQLALLIVVVNIAACLLAGRVMTPPEREAQPLALGPRIERPQANGAGSDNLPSAASMLSDQPNRDDALVARAKRISKRVNGNPD